MRKLMTRLALTLGALALVFGFAGTPANAQDVGLELCATIAVAGQTVIDDCAGSADVPPAPESPSAPELPPLPEPPALPPLPVP